MTAKTFCITFLTLMVILLLNNCRQLSESSKTQIEGWITTADQSQLLSPIPGLTFNNEAQSSLSTIEVDTTLTYQVMDGFGFALTGGSAALIHGLDSGQRSALLKELFLTEQNGIGISYLRISIGASDLDDHVFSYDDMAPGKTDPGLSQFSLGEDHKNLIPLLKEILSLNPKIKIMGSPWSSPLWMKSNHLAKGGTLLSEYYPAYANYFVKYIQAMDQEGITIDAITVQNEPENPKNTPSLEMTAPEQNNFIKNHLGPAFKNAGIKTKIILFDHNADHPEYPISILNDSVTKKYVDGSAFHLYLGEVDALSTTHNVHPDKNIYFTEQWTSGKGEFKGDLNWHIKNLIVGAPRNWSKNVLEWNLAADENFNPHTPDGGCDLCQGALTIKGKTITRNVSYYIVAHASKFVPPGSARISSSLVDPLPNVAFQTPEGKKVLIVLNSSSEENSFTIRNKNKSAKTSLPGGAVATYVWR